MRLLLSLLVALSFTAALSAAEKPNFVFITCEDISPNLGCYGDPDAITPNLDKLASQGTRFTRAFSHAPVCAISANKPDEVLHWFDKMRFAQRGTHEYYSASHYTEQVAAAVATAYPERALEIYRVGLDAQLPHADPRAYANAAGYLRKLRPIYESLGRLTEWTALVNSIREKYKNRPRFMEQLDNLDGRTIVETVRKSRKG